MKKVLKFGIAPVSVQRARSLAIAAGTRQRAKDEISPGLSAPISKMSQAGYEARDMPTSAPFHKFMMRLRLAILNVLCAFPVTSLRFPI